LTKPQILLAKISVRRKLIGMFSIHHTM